MPINETIKNAAYFNAFILEVKIAYPDTTNVEKHNATSPVIDSVITKKVISHNATDIQNNLKATLVLKYIKYPEINRAIQINKANRI